MNSFYDMFSGKGTDIVGALSVVGDLIKDLAEGTGIPALVFYAVGAVLSLLLGLFAYKIVKLLTGLAAGAFAFYFLGGLVYAFILSAFKFQLNDIVRYIISGVLALVFFIIGFKRFRYVVFAAMAMIGYLVTVFYVSPYIEGVAAPITGAIVFALFAVVCLRWAFAIATSFMFGFTLVYMLSCAFPTVEILNLQSNVIALAIAGGAALIMLIVQLLVTRGQGSGEGAVVKRVRGNVRRKEIITEY